MMVQNYDDFVQDLLEKGFSMGGGNSEGIYAVVPFSWDDEPIEETPIKWHTGNPETDPWEWRMRVLDERDDIAYAKIYFKKSGYLTREWAPYFIAARRNNMTFEDAFLSGTITQLAKKLYDIIAAHDQMPLHTLKALAQIGKEDKTKFESAMTELQMKLYITMCGREQKVSLSGNEYGWSSTVFCTTETFWGEDVFTRAGKITQDEAVQAITEQVKKLNPAADAKKITKFIKG